MIDLTESSKILKMLKKIFFLTIFILDVVLTEKLIDLTYSVDDSTIYWPTGSSFNYTQKVAEKTPDGFFYSANEFKTPEHLGTHMDAPYHFCETCLTVDQIPIENFIANGFLIDIREKCNSNRNYLLSIEDFKLTPKDFDALRGQKNILLIRTGWGKYWNDKEKYLGTNDNDVSKLSFPGIGEDAANYIAHLKLFVGVGIDTASTDFGQSKNFKTHQVFAHNGIYAIENLANLDLLPLNNFTLYAFPMKLKGGTGGPIRVIARLSSKYRKVDDLVDL